MNWRKFDIDITIYPSDCAMNERIHPSIITRICDQGLPSWCAPHLYFGDFDGRYLPVISEWSWAGDWGSAYYHASKIAPSCMVLGVAQEGNPIVILPNDPSIYLFSPDGMRIEKLNSSIDEMTAFLYAFTEMIEEAVMENENAFSENTIRTALIDSFIAKISAYASQKECNIWKTWAIQKGVNAVQ